MNMTSSAPGERTDRSSCFTACFKRNFKKHDARAQNSPDSLPTAEESPARSASNQPNTSQETNAATNTDATTSIPSTPSTNAAAGGIGAADTLIKFPTDATEEGVESDLWSLAYQKLDDKTKEWIDDYSNKDSGEENAQDLIEIVRKREKEYKDGTPKLKIGDHEILWRDYANKVVTWVTAIGDISISFAPAPSSVVWSAVKVLLKANVSQCEDLAAILGCADKVLQPMRNGKIYEEVYLSDGSYNTAARNLQDALVEQYKAAMELLSHAFALLNKGQLRQFLSALTSSGEGAKLVSALADQERKVSMAAQGCGAVASQEHQKLLQTLDEPLKKLLEMIQDDKLEQLLDCISTVPIGRYQQEKSQTRTPETGEWLLSHPKFREWEESSCSSTLWLQGKVGAGKSFLTSKVVDDLPAIRQQKAKYDEGFAYFYCSRSDPVRRVTKDILSSYIAQLARIPNYPTMMEKSIYNLCCVAKKKKKDFSIDECTTALMELVKFYPRTTFILDALDECELNTRQDLVRILRDLVDKGEGTVKVFIASRKETDIERFLGSQKLVEISTADNKGDIEKYIEEEIEKIGDLWSCVSDEVKKQVRKTIREKSDGMFRWAHLQWEQLKDFRTSCSVLQRLGELPESLTDAYHEIYSKIKEEKILQQAVKWVICAREPLTSEALLMAIRLECNHQSITLSDPISEPILEDICSHLIVLDSRLKVWKFPHASVAEYFEDQHKSWIDKAREDVAVLLVSCLIDCYSVWTPPGSWYTLQNFFTTASDLGGYLDPRHPLQRYAGEYWLHHVQNTPNQCQEATRLSDILKRFLGAQGPQRPSSLQYQAWCSHMRLDCRLYLRYDWNFDIQPSEKSIFGICILGLHKLLKGWWDEDIDVSQVNDEGLDLLGIAAKYGHDDLCSELIERGSDIHRGLDSMFGSAFMEAIKTGQITAAGLLLDKGVDPNLIRKGVSPLCLAVQCAKDLVGPLLEAGADPNITCSDCDHGCALEATIYWNQVKPAELLIEYGADMNLVTEIIEYGSLLGAAVYQDSLKFAKLFVENGADVNAHLGGRYGSVLACAIFGWGEGIEMVRYLIEEAGADPAVLSSSPSPSPLWAGGYDARYRRRVAKYLLDGGYVQESVLLDIGFPREELSTTEIEG